MEITINQDLTFYIQDESTVLYARHKIKKFALSIGFPEFELDKIELIISEVGTNIVKYAKKGVLTVRGIKHLAIDGIEIISEDEGQGISNFQDYINNKPSLNLKDSLKAGLTTIYNLSDEFVVDSSEKGTKMVIRKWLPYGEGLLKYSVISRPKPGEVFNGDNFYIKQLPRYSFFSVIDGLGHGEEASIAANKALECMKIFYYLPLEELMEKCHTNLKSTRGAVLSFCRIDKLESRLEYLGVGNVEMKVLNQPTQLKIYNYNGTIGMHMEDIRVQEMKFYSGATFIMYTDGIKDFPLDKEILRMSPQKIASHVIENFSKSSDDATILVAR